MDVDPKPIGAVPVKRKTIFKKGTPAEERKWDAARKAEGARLKKKLIAIKKSNRMDVDPFLEIWGGDLPKDDIAYYNVEEDLDDFFDAAMASGKIDAAFAFDGVDEVPPEDRITDADREALLIKMRSSLPGVTNLAALATTIIPSNPGYVQNTQAMVERRKRLNSDPAVYPPDLIKQYKLSERPINQRLLEIMEQNDVSLLNDNLLRKIAANYVYNYTKPVDTYKEAVRQQLEIDKIEKPEIQELRELVPAVIEPDVDPGTTPAVAPGACGPSGPITDMCCGQDENVFFIEIDNCS